MMKKIIITMIIVGVSFNVMAQETIIRDTFCDFLKAPKFKNGIDTIAVKATYNAVIRGAYGPQLKILANAKKIYYSEYEDQDESYSLSFTPLNCDKLYQGTISRKIYDKTFVRKTNNLGEYVNDIVDMDSLKDGQVIYLKCIVFEDKKVYFNRYFFTIVDIGVEKN